MDAEIVEYSGYLTFSPLPSGSLDRVRRAMAERGLAFHLGSGWIEIEYAGRDHKRKVVTLLLEVAAIVGDADGDVVCQLNTDSVDPSFEFYSISGGQLLRQGGRLVRDAAEVVAPRDVHHVT